MSRVSSAELCTLVILTARHVQQPALGPLHHRQPVAPLNQLWRPAVCVTAVCRVSACQTPEVCVPQQSTSFAEPATYYCRLLVVDGILKRLLPFMSQ